MFVLVLQAVGFGVMMPVHVDDGDTEGGATAGARGPQSVQSVPNGQKEYAAPTPPSSQSPSVAKLHASLHPATADGDEVGAAAGAREGGREGGLPMGYAVVAQITKPARVTDASEDHDIASPGHTATP